MEHSSTPDDPRPSNGLVCMQAAAVRKEGFGVLLFPLSLFGTCYFVGAWGRDEARTARKKEIKSWVRPAGAKVGF